MLVSRDGQPSSNMTSLFYGDQTILEEIVHEAIGNRKNPGYDFMKLYWPLMKVSFALLAVSLCLLLVSFLLYIFIAKNDDNAWRKSQRKQK